MERITKIVNSEIEIKTFKGQRVVTFKDIDLVHQRPDGTADRNFRENKEKFLKDEDYFQLSKSLNNEIRGLEIPNRGITVITESGYLMLVKSFTDDLAWNVQRKLVNYYFRAKENKPKTAIQIVQEAILEVNDKIDNVNNELQEFKKDMPLLGLECDEIKNAKNKKIVPLLGGKNASAYKDKSLRGKVYSDINIQLCREFDVSTYKAIKRSQTEMAVKIIKEYKLPMALEEQINNLNNQVEMHFV